MTECDEIADNMATSAPVFATMDAARHYVRQQMPDETTQIIDNVAESLLARQRTDLT